MTVYVSPVSPDFLLKEYNLPVATVPIVPLSTQPALVIDTVAPETDCTALGTVTVAYPVLFVPATTAVATLVSPAPVIVKFPLGNTR